MFRRRKKLSENVKPNTFTYYKGASNGSKKAKDASNRSLLRSLKNVLPRFSFFRILVVLSGLVIIGFLLSADTGPIIRFSSSGINARDTRQYKNETKKIISKSIFNRSKLTFDYRGVEKDLKTSFPEIEEVSVTFDIIGRKPVVQLSMHKPSFMFQTNGVTWAIDDRGVAIGQQADLKDSFTGTLDTIIDEIGVDADVGDTLISPSHINFLETVISMLAKQQAVVEVIYIPSNPKQIDVTLRDETWRYKLNPEGEATLQAGTLLASRATLRANGNVPSEYVDLRVSEKVYWK